MLERDKTGIPATAGRMLGEGSNRGTVLIRSGRLAGSYDGLGQRLCFAFQCFLICGFKEKNTYSVM